MCDTPGSWSQSEEGRQCVFDWECGSGATGAAGGKPDQYAEITYDQDPGSSSWVGVATRIQGARNASCYLAFAYDDQVQLRADDSDSLSWTQLASANTPVGVAPAAADIARVDPSGLLQRFAAAHLHGDERDCVRDRAAGHCYLRNDGKDPFLYRRRACLQLISRRRHESSR